MPLRITIVDGAGPSSAMEGEVRVSEAVEQLADQLELSRMSVQSCYQWPAVCFRQPRSLGEIYLKQAGLVEYTRRAATATYQEDLER